MSLRLLDQVEADKLRALGHPSGAVLRGYDCLAVDAWGCGLVLFWLLAGFHPFNLHAQEPDWWFQQVQERDRSAFWEYVQTEGVSSARAVCAVIQRLPVRSKCTCRWQRRI